MEDGMNKLKLDLNELSVESFDTTRVEKDKGTVFGEQCTCPTQCTCPGCPTCDGTCPNNQTCQVTCYYTCDDRTCETCQGPSCQPDQCASAVYTCVCIE
jgi:hypothetical protein